MARRNIGGTAGSFFGLVGGGGGVGVGFLLSLAIATTISTALIECVFFAGQDRELLETVNAAHRRNGGNFDHLETSQESRKKKREEAILLANGGGIVSGGIPAAPNNEIARSPSVDIDDDEKDESSSASASAFSELSKYDVVKVAVFPAVKRRKRKANYRHLIEDGVNQSPLLEFVGDEGEGEKDGGEQGENELNELDLLQHVDGNVLWLLDHLAARERWGSSSRKLDGGWCGIFGDLLEHALEVRKDLNAESRWPIAVVDNRDYPYISYCDKIEAAVGSENVRYSFRSLVTKRGWSERKSWVRLGRVVDVRSQAPKAAYEHVHRPIGVRTDIVRAVAEQLREDYDGLKLCHDIEGRIDRGVDASYFWETQNYTRDDSFLRDKVYEVLAEFADEESGKGEDEDGDQGNDEKDGSSDNSNDNSSNGNGNGSGNRRHRGYNIQVGLQGEASRWGRKSVSPEYVEALLDSKIVVVAQRDYWEDHYRLFEAMVAGAMVMTDQMLSLPKGLEDKVSVVEYESADDLIAKLRYYLEHDEERVEVARKGRHVAMSRHRSWHHMEEIAFGAPVTVCGEGEQENTRCPYAVNARNLHEPC